MKRKILSILLTLAVVSSLGLVSALPVVANGGEPSTIPQILNVANWTEPVNVTGEGETTPIGRQATIKVDDTYHMWYATEKETKLNYTSSTSPTNFGTSTECTFPEGTPKDVGSVTVIHEGDTFYMITYGTSDHAFAIYTSRDGIAWTFNRVVFDGTYDGDKTFYKIDGPCLMKEDDNTYRLYFQGAKTGSPGNYYYDIFMAEANAAMLSAITASASSVNFVLRNAEEPVLPRGGESTWDNMDVLHPMVVKDGDATYYMWYRGQKTGGANPQLGFASSADGITWVKSRGNPVLPRGGDINADAEPSVIKVEDTWHIWYQSTPNGNIKHISATGPFEFSSIQAAITAASDGDTIQVAAGTYDEGEITVGKGLTIIGVADSGGEKPVIKGTLNFTDSADGSRLENLKFLAKTGTDNKRDDNIVLTKVDGFSIIDCEFDGTVDLTGDEPDDFTRANRAVQINSSGNNITIDNCKFDGGYYVTIQGYANNLTVKNCVIEGVKSGINLITGSNLTVKNTDISVIPQGKDNDTYCVRFASSSGTSNNMTIDGGTFTVADSDFTPAENVYHSAIVIRASAGGTLKANYLNLYGSVVNLSEVELDATNNWWGNASGPVEAGQGYTAYGNEIVGTGDVIYNPWLLEPVEKNVEIKTYDKTLALKDGWTLISVDKTVDIGTAWKGTNDIGGEKSIVVYKYGDGFEEPNPDDMSIVDAYYVKTDGGGGVGLIYSTDAPPMVVNKTLTVGWNLISCAVESDAYTLLSQLRFTGTGAAAITNLVGPGFYNQFTGNIFAALGVESDWTAIKGGDDEITLNPFDGYWVYMNAAKSYGVIPDVIPDEIPE